MRNCYTRGDEQLRANMLEGQSQYTANVRMRNLQLVDASPTPYPRAASLLAALAQAVKVKRLIGEIAKESKIATWWG